MNENILALYCQERALFRMVGLQIDNEQYIKEYIDYVANVILQFMVYKSSKFFFHFLEKI